MGRCARAVLLRPMTGEGWVLSVKINSTRSVGSGTRHSPSRILGDSCAYKAAGQRPFDSVVAKLREARSIDRSGNLRTQPLNPLRAFAPVKPTA